MKTIIYGATALLLSGTAMAAPAPTAATYGASAYSWTAAPQLGQAAWTGAMSYAEAASWTADKPVALTDAQIAEKDAWVAANPMSDTDMATTAKPVFDGQGGPYEPVSASKAMVGANPTTEPTGVRVAKSEMAMDHSNMVAANRTAEEMQSAAVYGKVDSVYTGVGGPLQEVRHYPRCRSRSDDRCQQGS